MNVPRLLALSSLANLQIWVVLQDILQRNPCIRRLHNSIASSTILDVQSIVIPHTHPYAVKKEKATKKSKARISTYNHNYVPWI